ncbi:MAG TPA: FecR family protein [Chitinophagaceae bacterium]|nr:FecR family protein [Chitinophagaceae bacterium]
MYDRFHYLVGKRLAKSASNSEEEELDELLNRYQELKQVYRILFLQQFQKDSFNTEQAEQAYATHFVKMQLSEQFESTEETVVEEAKKESSPGRRKGVLWTTSIAACLLLLSGSWYILNHKTSSAKSTTRIAKNEVVTKKGSKSKIVLPDGTQVWLNGDSKIIYSGDFQGTTREMQLIGEAYFDVKKDKSRPFIIHTKSIDVRVLGTAFNVRSYPSEKTTETSLIRGSVEVVLHNIPGKKSIILKPNEKLTVKNVVSGTRDSGCARTAMITPGRSNGVALGKIHFTKQDSSVVETSWTENKLVFDDEPFERVVANIERWYNVEFIIKNKKIKSKRFSADFENKSLSQVLEALSLALKFKYHIEDNRIILNN